MNKKNKKNVFLRKTFLLAFSLFLTLSFSFGTKKASAWDAMPAAIAKQVMEEIYDNIKGLTIANLKQAALKMIYEEIDRTLADIQGIGSGLITNWQDYLIGIPERESAAFMNDYLSDITQGRNSTRYRSVPVSQTLLSYANSYEGFGGKSPAQFALLQAARAQDANGNAIDDNNNFSVRYSYASQLQDMKNEIVRVNQANYRPEITCTDEMRTTMFDDNTLDSFWTCTEGINYAPLAYAHLQNVYEEEKEKQTLIQVNEHDGEFAPPKDADGNIVGSATEIKAVKEKSATLGMDMLANAESIPEVITSAVVQAINRSINQGIGAIKARAQRELSNVRRQITGKVRQEAQKVGPTAIFGRKTFYEQSKQ